MSGLRPHDAKSMLFDEERECGSRQIDNVVTHNSVHNSVDLLMCSIGCAVIYCVPVQPVGSNAPQLPHHWYYTVITLLLLRHVAVINTHWQLRPCVHLWKYPNATFERITTLFHPTLTDMQEATVRNSPVVQNSSTPENTLWLHLTCWKNESRYSQHPPNTPHYPLIGFKVHGWVNTGLLFQKKKKKNTADFLCLTWCALILFFLRGAVMGAHLSDWIWKIKPGKERHQLKVGLKSMCWRWTNRGEDRESCSDSVTRWKHEQHVNTG